MKKLILVFLWMPLFFVANAQKHKAKPSQPDQIYLDNNYSDLNNYVIIKHYPDTIKVLMLITDTTKKSSEYPFNQYGGVEASYGYIVQEKYSEYQYRGIQYYDLNFKLLPKEIIVWNEIRVQK